MQPHPQCSAHCSHAHIWVIVQSFGESWIGATSEYLPKFLCGFCSLCWLLCCCKVCCGQLTHPWSYFFMDRKDHMHFVFVENYYSAPLNSIFWSGRRTRSHHCKKDWCVKKCDEPECFMAPVCSLPPERRLLAFSCCAGRIAGRNPRGEMPALCSCDWGHSEQKRERGNIEKMMFWKVRQKVLLSPVVYLQFHLKGWNKKTSPSQPANCEVLTPWSL